MSDHEGTSLDSNYSTPVPELDDHTFQSPTVQKTRSRRGTANSIMTHPMSPNLAKVNDELLRTKIRDFEEAIVDDEGEGQSPTTNRRLAERRGTVTTIDRSISPPSSVKAFAEVRRREREANEHNAKDFAVDNRSLHSLQHVNSQLSGHSRRTRRYTNESTQRSVASSSKTAENDVCFPVDNETFKGGLDIDFDTLEDFIAEQEQKDMATPASQPRFFHDLRYQKPSSGLITTTDGDFISSGSINEKYAAEEVSHVELNREDHNRFDYFSSLLESTIHGNDLGDLLMPDENIRALFTIPVEEPEDGVWWLNMNNPTEEEIRVICKAFGIHPLTREDISTQEAREKIELFPNYYFASFRSFTVERVDGGKEYTPFNIYVIVFREGTLSFSFSPNAHGQHVRQRITSLKDFVAVSSDWICYALIDDIVDSFAPVINTIEAETDQIDDQVFVARADDMNQFLRKIGMARKNVMGLMKLLGGKADVLRGFTKRCNTNYKVTPRMDIGLYLGDIQDHVVTMMNSLGHFEKMLSRSHSNYLAQLSIDNITQGNNANKVLSKITVLASILVPLNLVCGLFGMNVAVPWKNNESLIPFFGILGSLFFFVLLSLLVAKRFRYL
ncbi:putative metal ion transporter C27B12.12c [Calycina marina]|uniref:Metal ion transporter C27B12.12c n=1 Tax=Calycina marina TaxID=1763456 RepID=A0A9P7ZCV9_9HELO|nr:putative metal ion transporter C27B12.12c [Calycina marina]